MWTTKKLVLTGLFGALASALYLTVSLPIVAIAGSGMGVIIMPFLTLFLLIFFKQILPDFGSISLLG